MEQYYKPGQIMHFMMDDLPHTGKITHIEDFKITLEILTRDNRPVVQWNETMTGFDLDTKCCQYNAWHETHVSPIESKLNSIEKLIQYGLDHMDVDYENAAAMRQAYIEAAAKLNITLC